MAVSLLAVLCLSWMIWNRLQKMPLSPQQAANLQAPAAIERFGNLDVKVWGEGHAFDLVNRVPVFSGERVQINAPLRAKHNGELWLLGSDGKTKRLASFQAMEDSRWVHYPADFSDAVPVTGPAGTEAVIWIESADTPPQQALVRSLREPDSWPAIGDASVFRLVDEKLLVEQADRSFGDPTSLESPESVVQKHLRTLAEELKSHGKQVEILAFSHVD